MDRRQDGSEKNYNRHVETLGKINTTEILMCCLYIPTLKPAMVNEVQTLGAHYRARAISKRIYRRGHVHENT